MRKAASIMLAAAMVLGLTACSGGGETATATTQAAATEGTTAKAAADAVTEAVGSEASAEGYTMGFSPDALVYIPYDSASSRTALEACRAAGIKVINVDNVVTEDEFDLIDGIIASDNTQLGYLSGQWVAEHHPDGANILIVHLQTAESCVISVDGFWKGVKENTDNPDAFVEVQVVEGKGETSTAFEVTADALQAHDNIDVIYCINDPSALGAVQAVEEAGRAGKVDVLGKDAAPISKHAIKEGKIAQSSAQRPTYMGYKGVYSLVELLKGGSIEFNEYIDSYSVTADNIDEFDLDSWDILE